MTAANSEFRISRAQFVRAMIGAAVGWPLALRAGAQQQQQLIRVERKLVPVNVSPARVIRTVVGLRPYRAPGFVLKAERFGSKVLVHNYGHGGGGVSLSWGCATLAADLVAGRSPTKAAVIGAGVSGLSTARILQDRGWAVTIYTEKVSPNTTSNIAGAFWGPTSVYSSSETTPEFRDSFFKAAKIANRSFQLMVGNTYGVRWIESYTMENPPDTEDIIDYATKAGFVDAYADIQSIDPQSTPFTFKHIRRFSTMLIEPNIYLPAVMRDFFERGGKICVRKFDNMHELHKLPEHIIFNCTGLGAHELFSDSVLEPIRGQLTILEPQPEVDYVTFPDSLYMFPRSDGIVLGGTYDRGNWSLEPDMETQGRILTRHTGVYRVIGDQR